MSYIPKKYLPKHLFDLHESDLEIKFFLLIETLIIAIFIAFLGSLLRFIQGYHIQGMIDFSLVIIFTFLVYLLYKNRKFYNLASKILIVFAYSAIYFGIFLTQATAISLTLLLVMILASQMFIEGKEQKYWFIILFSSLIAGTYIFESSLSQIEMVLFFLLAIFAFSSIKAFEKIVLSSKTYQIKLASDKRNILLGNLVSMIAHEWRQPLATISAITSKLELKRMLNKELDLNEEIEDFQKIEAMTQNMSHTIGKFQDIFKAEPLKEKIEIGSLIKNALKTFSFKSDKPIEVQVIIHDKCFVYLSIHDVTQAIHYILENAYERFDKMYTEAKLVIVGKKVGKDSIITFTNNAGRIAEENLPKIFDPYFSTKIEKQGVGMGLFMASTLVHKNNGSIGVSNIDDGVTFTLRLPST